MTRTRRPTPALLESGVAIYEHKAALMHAKTAVVDGVWSAVGLRLP